eukprot:m.173993 g.173993  ORF g.173993 m.173993 type:complete len:886 (+) comp17324_c5_seq4:27-2684(+)
MASVTEKVKWVQIAGAEKRREGGKHYVYEIRVTYDSAKTTRIWRRYRQFDDLRETMLGLVDDDVVLPKLTSKIYLSRSSVHTVAIARMPKLQSFLTQLLTHKDKARKREIEQIFNFFLIPTAADQARSNVPDPEDAVPYGSTVTSLAVAQEAVARAHGSVRALHDYAPEESDGLAFSAGDIITLYNRPDENWMEGELKGQLGIFPANLVEVLADIPAATGAANMGPGSSAHLDAKPRGPIEELVSSEQKYVDALIAARDEYFPKLRHFVSIHEATQMFNNWSELITVSTALLEALKAESEAPLPALVRQLPLMVPVYSKYCAGVPHAQELYERKLTEKLFTEFERSIKGQNKPTLDYIMRPVQRIMKYPLLLKAIQDRLEKNSPEQVLIAEAMEAAFQLADAANRMERSNSHSRVLAISGPSMDSFQILHSVTSTGDSSDSEPLSPTGMDEQGRARRPTSDTYDRALAGKRSLSYPTRPLRPASSSEAADQSAAAAGATASVGAGAGLAAKRPPSVRRPPQRPTQPPKMAMSSPLAQQEDGATLPQPIAGAGGAGDSDTDMAVGSPSKGFGLGRSPPSRPPPRLSLDQVDASAAAAAAASAVEAISLANANAEASGSDASPPRTTAGRVSSSAPASTSTTPVRSAPSKPPKPPVASASLSSAQESSGTAQPPREDVKAKVSGFQYIAERTEEEAAKMSRQGSLKRVPSVSSAAPARPPAAAKGPDDKPALPAKPALPPAKPALPAKPELPAKPGPSRPATAVSSTGSTGSSSRIVVHSSHSSARRGRVCVPLLVRSSGCLAAADGDGLDHPACLGQLAQQRQRDDKLRPLPRPALRHGHRAALRVRVRRLALQLPRRSRRRNRSPQRLGCPRRLRGRRCGRTRRV